MHVELEILGPYFLWDILSSNRRSKFIKSRNAQVPGGRVLSGTLRGLSGKPSIFPRVLIRFSHPFIRSIFLHHSHFVHNHLVFIQT